MKKILISTSALIALLIAGLGVSAAQEYEYNEYTVKSGDTLWGISGVELKDEFLWPMVWKENEHIKNPDRIYPGQKVRIPKSWLKQGEMTLDEVKEAYVPEASNSESAVPPVPKPESKTINTQPLRVLASRELLLWNGYIADSVPNKGSITDSALGTESIRSIFGKGDEIYIKTDEPAHVGQKFYVLRAEQKVSHPVKMGTLGTLVRVVGTIQVDEDGSNLVKAHVIEAFTDIDKKDILDTYYEVEIPFITGEPRKPPIEDAYVVASDKMRALNGWRDIVFIDKGERDGVQVGDLYMTLLPGTDDKRNAVIQILNVRKDTSLAVINDSRMSVDLGSVVTGMKE